MKRKPRMYYSDSQKALTVSAICDKRDSWAGRFG